MKKFLNATLRLQTLDGEGMQGLVSWLYTRNLKTFITADVKAIGLQLFRTLKAFLGIEMIIEDLKRRKRA